MPTPFVLKTTHSAPELAIAFDQKFDTSKPTNHIHGAILALCNPGFDKPKTRGAVTAPVIDLSCLKSRFSNIELLFRNALAEGAINFRPDTPIHGNDEGRYEGGSLKTRLGRRARHFEFGAVGGGMRVVYDLDTNNLYISAHYSYPGRLIASPGSVEEDWLLTTKARMERECWAMAEHASGASRSQADRAEDLEGLSKDAERLGLSRTAADGAQGASLRKKTLHERALRNRAFSTWLHDPQSGMTSSLRKQIYGLGA